MFKRLALLVVALVCLGGFSPSMNEVIFPKKRITTYQGPGDIVAGAQVWWGLRAYSAADRGNKLINICDASLGNCKDWFSDSTTGKLVATTLTGGTDCTAVNTCKIKIWYDRSGSNLCSAAPCDFNIIANPATLTWSCINGLPCAVFNSAGPSNYATAASSLTIAGGTPFTMSSVANRTDTTTGGILGVGSTNFGFLAYAAGAGIIAMFNNTSSTVANVTDVNFHAFQALFNGASSILNCAGSAGTSCSTSGTETTTNPGALGITSGQIMTLGELNGASNLMDGDICEVGEWNTGFSSGQRTSMASNQYTFWGPF